MNRHGPLASLDQALDAMASRPEREVLRPSELLGAVRQLAARGELAGAGRPGGDPGSARRLAQLRTVARRLIRQNKYQPAHDLLELVLPTWRPDPTTGLPALAAHALTSLTGRAPDALVPAADAALQGADRAWAESDTGLAAELVVIGAGLLLHRDLHADVVHSPLADDPVAFLTPLRRSLAASALRAPVPGRRRAHAWPRPDPAGRTRRVVVLPGTYPRFATPLIELLRRRSDLHVDVVDLPGAVPSLRWLGTDPELVRLRLRATLGDLELSDEGTDEFGVGQDVRALVMAADVVVVDWADRGAVWASLVTPPTARLVVRAHGMDSLSLWPHALDWTRVNALVTVSPHHAQLTDEILDGGHVPSAEQRPRCMVVPNVVRLAPSARRSTGGRPAPPPRAPHTLGMIGWGKRVKDPLWAVEVLARLRDRGGADWRLRLVGHRFAPGGVLTGQEYAQMFEERLARRDVAGAITMVPQTDDVAAEVNRLGFVISASRRESFHLGLVEGVLGGAVPVVRDWPFYARQGGASRLFPEQWVVPDVDAAVERIWRLRDDGDRRRAADQARLEVDRRFDPARSEALLLEAVLGPTHREDSAGDRPWRS